MAKCKDSGVGVLEVSLRCADSVPVGVLLPVATAAHRLAYIERPKPMATYRAEFPNFFAADMPVIPAGFSDTSWHNDACPSFTSDSLGLTIWIDFANPSEREFQNRERFNVVPQKDGIETSGGSLQSDDWSAVVAFVRAKLATLDPAELNAFYAEAVGYRPQEDSPDMSDSELRSLCLEYFETHLVETAAAIAEAAAETTKAEAAKADKVSGGGNRCEDRVCEGLPVKHGRGGSRAGRRR